ncbi:hypothetical protein H0H87_006405 [Tephrocybe sp. NHM501043]|nr:hypothetical protein H0H87_006405 [Tephrocybe sp. NHM501043]
MALRLELFDILRAYASLAPLKKIAWPINLSFDVVHGFLLETVLLSSHLMQYPPAEQYQATFWKWAIQHLESMTAMTDNEASPSYITHYWDPLAQASPEPEFISLSSYETVTLLESRTTIESGTTGMRTWLASFVLSEYFTQHPDLVKNKRILELGSGIGFLGIVLGRLQQLASQENSPKHQALWLTDINENVLTRCQENIQMPCNKILASDIHYSFLDWTDSQTEDRIGPLKSLLVHEIDADLIVGADIIFDPSLIPALAGVLHLALQPGRTGAPKSALIAATIRNEETFKQFQQALLKKRLQVLELSITHTTSFMQDVDNNIENVKIFQITL